MSWPEQKNTFIQRKLALDNLTSDSAVQTLSTQINNAIKQYSSTGGISSDPNKNQAHIDANIYLGKLVDLDKQYQKLNTDLAISVKTILSGSDITGKLANTGVLQDKIANLQKGIAEATNDEDVSKNRKESVENTELNVSWYQGFASKVGFNKPLHPISVPILIGFGIFLLIMSGLMLKEFFYVPGESSNQAYDSESLFSLFNDSRLYSVIAAFFLVVVVLGILSYRGYFGKSIN